jgi:hypothetical protein
MHPSKRLLWFVSITCAALVGGFGCGTATAPPADPVLTNASILGSGAATYTEASEASNLCTSPETLGHTLDATGITISGTVEASGPTYDCFRFSAGTYTWAKTKVFVGGVATAISVSVKCDGYSELSNVATGLRYGVTQGISCNLTVKPTSAQAGISYSVELVGST